MIDVREARSIIIDANSLVFFIVGATDRSLVARHKRCAPLLVEDFELVERLLLAARSLVLLSSVLTETSNLLRQTRDDIWQEIAPTFVLFVSRHGDRHVPSADAVAHPGFVHYGLTDAAILTACGQDSVGLTTDGDLFGAVWRKGSQAINPLAERQFR